SAATISEIRSRLPAPTGRRPRAAQFSTSAASIRSRSIRRQRGDRCMVRPTIGSAGLDTSAGARLENETGFTDSGTRTTTDRTNLSAFVEARGSGLDRAYVSGGLGVEKNAVFGVAVTPRISAAFYARKLSRASAAFGETKLTFNFGKGIKE